MVPQVSGELTTASGSTSEVAMDHGMIGKEARSHGPEDGTGLWSEEALTPRSGDPVTQPRVWMDPCWVANWGWLSPHPSTRTGDTLPAWLGTFWVCAPDTQCGRRERDALSSAPDGCSRPPCRLQATGPHTPRPPAKPAFSPHIGEHASPLWMDGEGPGHCGSSDPAQPQPLGSAPRAKGRTNRHSHFSAETHLQHPFKEDCLCGWEFTRFLKPQMTFNIKGVLHFSLI